jgi:cytochrome P450
MHENDSTINENNVQVQVLLKTLATEEGRLDPYPVYQGLRQHPPVYDERHRAYLTTRYHDCLEALTGKSFGRPDRSWLDRRIPDWRQRPTFVMFSHMMQFGTPDTHARLRGSVKRFLTARRVNSLVEFESDSVDELLNTLADGLQQHGVVDLQESFSYQLPSISIAALLGLPKTDVTHFRRLTLALARVLEPGLTPRQLAELDDAYHELGSYFEGVIADRRENPRDDLSTYLVQCCDDDKVISPDELLPMFLSVYAAGSGNTSNFIGNGVAALLSTPSEAATVRSNPDLTDAAVTEVLRYDAPMQVTRRITLTDTDLGGTTIPAGEEIAVVLGAANRDSDIFPDPDAFRIRRDHSRPLTFGAGTFFCIGAALARLEGVLVFRRLISRFPTLRLAEGAIHNRRSVLRGYDSLPVTLEPSD